MNPAPDPNPFGKWFPGMRRAGIPSALMNALIDSLGENAGGGGPATRATSTEARLLNSTGSNLDWLSIVQVGAPVVTQAENDSEYATRRAVTGTAPAAGSPFAVLIDAIPNGTLGRATLLGLTPVKVTINDTAHRYADCTAATDKLSSGPTGPARILWDEDNFAAVGDKWALVDLTGTAPTAYARFALPSALAVTDASKAACTVDGYFGAGNPGSTITVFNLPASSNYIFSGASGNKGLAVYDLANQKWWIVQMQCP